MAKRAQVTGPKTERLRADGVWNARSERVTDHAFREHEFFDSQDLVQVKYEMVRRVRIEGRAVTETAAAFGFSRPSFYEAQAAFERDGLPGLLPRKRGPRSAHKLTEEIVAFILEALTKDDSLDASGLVRLVASRFGVAVHPRSITRALRRARQGKKRR